MLGDSVPRRVAYLWTRAAGTGGLLVAGIASFAGPNMWNLGRIIAAGMALVCLPITVGLAFAPRRPVPSTPAVASLAAFLLVAATWFVAGLLGWVGVADPIPLQDILRWLVVPLGVLAVIATACFSGEGAGLSYGRLLPLLVDLLAHAAAAAAGIMLAAAPFELVGADVRAFLVAVFAVALVVHLLSVAARARGVGAVADGGISGVPPDQRPAWAVPGVGLGATLGVGLGVASVTLAVVPELTVPGWAGPIAGGLLGQGALCLTVTGYHHRR